MVMQFLNDFGAWSWFVLGLVLLILEVLAPGVFFIWFGSAALVIGTLSLLPFADVKWWPWQAQLVAFAVLSLVFTLVGRRLFPNVGVDDDAAHINKPLDRFIGSEAALAEPLENGVGRVRLGDTMWRVRGPDLPKGSKIRVTGTDGSSLLVEAA